MVSTVNTVMLTGYSGQSEYTVMVTGYSGHSEYIVTVTGYSLPWCVAAGYEVIWEIQGALQGSGRSVSGGGDTGHTAG